MAKIKNGILGGFSGKIGNVVGIKNPDGSYIIRSVQAVVNNPQTPAQQTQRIGFSLCAGLFPVVEPFVAAGLHHVAGKKPRGAFISLNCRSAIGGAYPDLHLDYPYLKVASGPLMPASGATASLDDQGNLAFTWADNTGQGGARANDRVMLLAIYPQKKTIAYTIKGNPRSDGWDVLPLGKAGPGDELHAYIAFISASGNMVSDSVYVPAG